MEECTSEVKIPVKMVRDLIFEGGRGYGNCTLPSLLVGTYYHAGPNYKELLSPRLLNLNDCYV